MRTKRRFQIVGSALLIALAFCVLLLGSGQVLALSTSPAPHVTRNSAATSISVNAYLTGTMLQPIFQSNINQQLPKIIGNAITSMVRTLPQQDQGWASQMANTLLQPSVTLQRLTPQAHGLLATVKISLYPGDPKPITTSILIGFSVLNASTIQVSALPIKNGSTLVSGPLTTFHLPAGTLNSIAPSSTCGVSELEMNLTFPISLNGQTSGQSSHTTTRLSYQEANTSANQAENASSTPGSYIEIPASSLARLGSAMGTLQISSSLTAQKIQVSVQGSNIMTSDDIYWHGIDIGNAVSTLVPTASGGHLLVHIVKTDLHILHNLITFPLNQYNQNIEQLLNAELSSALSNTFSVTQAAIGPNAQLPCAAATSLLLAGSIELQ